MQDIPTNKRPGPLTEEEARKIWKILVGEAGADKRTREEDSFVYHATREHNLEWRFCGVLGFGGKFKNNTWGWYIDCYVEDNRDDRIEIIEKVNKILREMNNGA